MTYVIKRNNKRYNKMTFKWYEEARYYVRQKLAKMGTGTTRTATLKDNGFSIERVA